MPFLSKFFIDIRVSALQTFGETFLAALGILVQKKKEHQEISTFKFFFLIFILQKQFVWKAFKYSIISGGIDKSALCPAEAESQSQAQREP